MKNDNSHWLTKKKCPVCGKEFYPATLHAYKDARDKTKLVCTYPCYRKSERLLDEKRASKQYKKRGPKPKGDTALKTKG